jgi:hypothetical protein
LGERCQLLRGEFLCLRRRMPLVFAFVVTMAIHVPDLGNLLPHWVLQPFDPNDKTNLAPYRVVHLIAIAVVVTQLLPAKSPILQWRALAPLIRCGQNSLQVFCIGIVLSFCAQAAIETSLNSLWVQIFVGATGILVMTATAYYWTWYKRQDRAPLFAGYSRPLLKLEYRGSTASQSAGSNSEGPHAIF